MTDPATAKQTSGTAGGGGDNFHEPIEHWGSAPGPRASLIVDPDDVRTMSLQDLVAQAALHSGPRPSLIVDPAQTEQPTAIPAQRALDSIGLDSQTALQSLITATGSHVTLGTPCVAADEIPVTDEMIDAAKGCLAIHPYDQWLATIYRAMAAVAPVEPENAGLWASVAIGYKQRNVTLEQRIAALEADNEAHIAALVKAGGYIATLGGEISALKAQLATFGPITPADLPDPPRRADGTLAPQPRRLPGVAELPPEKRVGG